MMLAWRHYGFKQFLLHKASQYQDVKVIICNESYTSKTCSRCGAINEKLGGLKKWKCAACHQFWERDFNAARNIYLRVLTLFLAKKANSLQARVSSIVNTSHKPTVVLTGPTTAL